MSYHRGGTPHTPRGPATRNTPVEPATPTRTHRGQPRSAQTPNSATHGPFMRTTVTTEVFAPSQAAPPTQPVPNAIVGAQNALSALALSPLIKVYRIPSPSEIQVLSSSRGYYVITRGQQVGIFKTWNECDARVEGVRDDSIYQKADSWVNAIAMFSLAYYDGTIEAIPIANGVYDTPHFTIPSPNGRSGTAQFNLPQPQTRNIDIPQPHELHPPRKLGTHFYVVLRGEEVGIYGCWHEAATRTRLMAGINNCKTRDTWEEALECYTAAYLGHRLYATGKIENGQHMTIEHVQFR